MRRFDTGQWPRLVGTGLIVGGMMAASVVLASTTAGAKPASGTITCAVTGTITFLAPLTPSATKKVRTDVALKLSGCVVGGGIGAASVGHTTNYNSSKSNIYKLTGGCAALSENNAVPTTWKSITPLSFARDHTTNYNSSKSNFSGVEAESGLQGQMEWVYPGVGGTASGSGSFTGTDGGASSTMRLISNTTAAQAMTTCESPGGLKSLSIDSGTFFSG